MSHHENQATPEEVVSLTALFGSFTSGVSYTMSQDVVMLILSVSALAVSILGLLYAIWKGERSYKLEMLRYEQERIRSGAVNNVNSKEP